jgi:hypothetical protein
MSHPHRNVFIDVFRSIDTYFLKSYTDWKYAIDFCSHDAAGMTGLYFGVAERIKEVADDSLQVRPRMIDLKMFSSRGTAAELSQVLYDCVKAVKFVRSKALNS